MKHRIPSTVWVMAALCAVLCAPFVFSDIRLSGGADVVIPGSFTNLTLISDEVTVTAPDTSTRVSNVNVTATSKIAVTQVDGDIVIPFRVSRGTGYFDILLEATPNIGDPLIFSYFVQTY